MLNLAKPKIDSLRIIIPKELVTINPDQLDFFNSILYSKTSLNTGENIEWEDQPTTYFNKDAVISCSYAYAPNQFYNKTTKCDVVKIGFSSKLCKDLYFQGINKNTLKRCLNFINSEGLITISEKDFLNAKVVDVDVCIDYFLKDTTCKNVVSIANSLTVPRKGLILPAPHLKPTNIGIQWGARTAVKTAYGKRQFLKYYSKVEELKHKSTSFYLEYIKPQLDFSKYPFFLDNRVLRCETTLKNKDHWSLYGLTVDTLFDLMQVDLTKNLSIFNRPINYYMTAFKRIQFKQHLSPSDKMYLVAIESQSKLLSLPQVDTIDLIVNTLEIKNKSQRSKFAKKLFDLYTQSKAELAETKQLKFDLETIEMARIGLIPKL
jgi:hypothetical protein